MTSLLEARQYLKNFVGKYEALLMPLGKLILAIICLTQINSKLGYMSALNNMFLVLIVALMCSFMPMNFILVVSALFSLLHIYKLGLESALVIGAVFIILMLAFFRFAAKDAWIVLLMPIAFLMHIPYIIPIAAGLLSGPLSIVAVGAGVIVYYILGFVVGDANAITSLGDAEAMAKLKYIIEGALNNKAMVATVIAFAAVTLIVYMLRRLPIDYAWFIAIGVGTVASILTLLVADMMLETNVSIGGVIVGSILSGLLSLILLFFNFYVDYKRTEKVQFEDDDYYYYVKAVPKVTVSPSHKKVKRVNNRRKRDN